MKYLITILLIGCSFWSYGQTDIVADSTAPKTFLERVQLDLMSLQSEKGEGTSLFFQNYWNQNGMFTNDNKSKIEALYDQMEKDKLSLREYRLPFISTLTGAASNLKDPAQAISTFLEITERAYQELERKQFANMLRTTEQILERKALFYSKYYQLVFFNGSVSFEWPKVESIEVKEEIADEEEVTNEWGDEASDSWESTDSWGDSDDDGWGSGNSMEEDANPAEEEQTVINNFSTPMPELYGPIVNLKRIDLQFLTTSDTINIYNVSGKLELNGHTFVAYTGTLSWEHLGLETNELNAELSEFTFEVNKKEFSAEQVILNYPELIKKPVKGVIDFKAENRNKKQPASFPFFQSYQSGYELSVIDKKGLRLKGGLTLNGTQFSTAALDKSNSTLELQGEAVKKFSAVSREFHYQDSSFISPTSSVSIYQRKDSIYHPGLRFNYQVNENNLNLIKGKGNFKNTPFFASYFNMDFTADKISWDMDSTIVDISVLIAGNRVPAMFESAEYYNEYRYNSLSGLYGFHPLQLVVHYSRKARTNIFYVDEMMEKLKLNKDNVRASMRLLMENGFIKYDIFSGRIEMLDKAFHYVDSKWGKKDYDNVQISSISSGSPNGKLNLDKGTLDIHGVEDFEINEKLGIRVKPDSGRVSLRKNRDVQFNGTVFAGNYEYIGKDFEMDYDSFLISMPQIDKIKFNLNTNDNNRQSTKEKLQNQLVETAGVLYINDPNNKSAEKEYPKYPIFNATKGATVYFLGEEILGGVYDQSLYFVIPPFSIDSVSSTDPNSIAFEGIFHSGDIFPEFTEKLRVMPDKSLGFEHPLPEEGIDLLDGEARFYGNLKLDNSGLRGGTKIEYLTSTINSENFTFFKDSIVGKGTYAIIEPGDWEGVSFPEVSVVNYDMHWLTAKDSLNLYNLSAPFEMYGETAKLNGKATISKKGLFGSGELSTRGSNTKSKNYNFKEQNFNARNADFIIESTDTIPALSADDVRILFDFNENIATINPEIEGDAAINFPYTSYKTSIPSALWRLDEKIVAMEKPANINIKNSYFYATNPEQDSLFFNATKAIYDIDEQSLNVSGIPYITVADAQITPAGGEVIIGAYGKMNKLFNANIQLDTLTGYHNLYNAEIEILSRNKFEGNATYSYVNSVGDTFSIKMGQFSLEPIPNPGKSDRKLRTVSAGNVKKDDRMLISPGMFYKGAVTMYADKPALELQGYVQPDLKDLPNYDTWIAYTSDGSIKDVVINFDKSTTEMGNPLQAGLHFDNLNNELYATFMNDKRDFADTDFFKPSGILTYNSPKKQFIIESKDRSTGSSYAGKYFAYNEEEQKLEFSGPFNFIDNRKGAEFNIAGSGTGDLINQEFAFNLLMTVEFELPNTFTPIIGNDMIQVVQRLGIPESNKDLNRLLPKLAEIASNAVAKKYEENIFNDYIPLHTLSSTLTKTLHLNNVDMKWSPEQQAWYNIGKIGLSNTGAVDINANIDGFIEVQRKEMGTAVNIFLQVSPSCWYFFKYEGDQLIFFSSNEQANDLIDKKSKAGKAKFGEFVFLMGDKLEVTNFVEDYRRRYYDIDAPYYLEMASSASESASPSLGSDPIPETTPIDSDDDDGF